MENNDTPVVEETTPVTEEVTPVTEEVTPVVEETTPVVTEEVTTPEAKTWEEEITLDELLSALIPTNDEKETIPDWPVFDDTKKEDDSITEKELEELENEVWTIIDELETEVATANTKTEELSSQIEELNSKISDEQKNNEEIATALKKIVDHPSLWKFAKDILEWKEVDIPKILEDKVNEDIASMADISTQAPVSIEPKKVSLWQRLWSMRTL